MYLSVSIIVNCPLLILSIPAICVGRPLFTNVLKRHPSKEYSETVLPAALYYILGTILDRAFKMGVWLIPVNF